MEVNKMSQKGRHSVLSVENEQAKDYLDFLISLHKRTGKYIEDARVAAEENTVMSFGPDFGNKLISQLKTEMNKAYDFFVEAPDEVTIGPMDIDKVPADAKELC